jgi:hypothetical protein
MPVKIGSPGTKTILRSTKPSLQDVHPTKHSRVTSQVPTYSSYLGPVANSKAFCEHRLFSGLSLPSLIRLLVRRRYAYDSIHNAIAVSRQTLQRGGYSRVSGALFVIAPQADSF